MMTTNRNTAQAHGNEHRARKEVSPAPAPLEVPAGEIDRSIYVMPSFATFEVANLDASRRWYVEGLGFVVLATLPGQDGAPALVHLRRWRYQDLLLVPARHEAAGSRGAGVRVTFAAGEEDLASLAVRAARVPGGSVEGPAPTPWRTIDLVSRDPDGYTVVLTTYDAQRPPDPQWSEMLRNAVAAAQPRHGTGRGK